VRTIPVIDVACGVVVHATGGDRSAYRPIVTPLAPTPDPAAVAGALLRVTGAAELYVADLDALTGNARQSAVVSALISQLKCDVWLDAGVSDDDDLAAVEPGTKTILGTETLGDPGVIAQAAARLGADNVILSLDYRDGVLLGDDGDWEHRLYEAAFFSGLHRFVVLDLARVGSREGTGVANVIERLRKTFPAADLVAGGGVRTWADVERVESVGANGVLVATALHDGTITFPRPI
jgi:phosphoribosylformimino-5-aminoimidazole carboxamide ribotide isomerase